MMKSIEVAPNDIPAPWATIQYREHVHVIPQHDDQPHYFSQSCPCRVSLLAETRRDPADLQLMMYRIYTHNAMDGRE